MTMNLSAFAIVALLSTSHSYGFQAPVNTCNSRISLSTGTRIGDGASVFTPRSSQACLRMAMGMDSELGKGKMNNLVSKDGD